uniref:Carbohydrate ABC transporter permease n=1 Tax=Thermorudis peleae TaxID=1382356 RepID=A0A831XA21_9BACT
MLAAVRAALTTYVPVLPFVVFALFPYYHMAVTSLKADAELYNPLKNPLWIQDGATLDHYRVLVRETLFSRWYLNTFAVSAIATVASVIIGLLAAYALARLRFPGVGPFGVAIFVTYLVPPSLLFLPLAIVVNHLGLSDSVWSLVVTYPTFLVPFNTWLLMGYLRTIPRELEECAMIDGASRIQAMRRIILPLALPGVLSAAIFSFTLSWNEFLYALVFMGSGHMKTIPVGTVNDLIRADVFQWGPLMAAAVLGSVPVAVVYTFFVDHYVSGMTAGAVKG